MDAPTTPAPHPAAACVEITDQHLEAYARVAESATRKGGLTDDGATLLLALAPAIARELLHRRRLAASAAAHYDPRSVLVFPGAF